MKPSIPELIETFGEYYYFKDNNLTPNGDTLEKIKKLEEDNYSSLYKVTQKNYNQEGFNKLISSIESNGINHFNMTTFWGKISEQLARNSYNPLDMPVHELKLHYESTSIAKNSLDSYTSAFNCNSVGCIAGFATAVAMDWQQPNWLSGDSRNYMVAFENIACNYLNIPLEVGRKIFYGDPGCVWGFVGYYEQKNYPDISWENLMECDEINCDYDEQWLDESVLLSSIDYKTAVDVLRRIANGEIVFPRQYDYVPKYSKSNAKAR